MISGNQKRGDDGQQAHLLSSSPLDQALANELFAYIRDHSLTNEQVQVFFSPAYRAWCLQAQDAIPISIFDNEHLSSLETVVKYLKENMNYSFVKIAALLNRSAKTVWATYSNARKKMPLRFSLRFSPVASPSPSASSITLSTALPLSAFFIPLTRFSNRQYSPLEVVVKYLKEDCNQRYHQIAVLIHRDDRTVWTVYNRMKKKMAHKAK